MTGESSANAGPVIRAKNAAAENKCLRMIAPLQLVKSFLEGVSGNDFSKLPAHGEKYFLPFMVVPVFFDKGNAPSDHDRSSVPDIDAHAYTGRWPDMVDGKCIESTLPTSTECEDIEHPDDLLIVFKGDKARGEASLWGIGRSVCSCPVAKMDDRAEEEWLIAADRIVAAEEKTLAIRDVVAVGFPEGDHVFEVAAEFDRPFSPNCEIETIHVAGFEKLIFAANTCDFGFKVGSPSAPRLKGIVGRIIAQVTAECGNHPSLIDKMLLCCLDRGFGYPESCHRDRVSNGHKNGEGVGSCRQSKIERAGNSYKPNPHMFSH